MNKFTATVLLLLLSLPVLGQNNLLDSIGNRNFYPLCVKETPAAIYYMRMLQPVQLVATTRMNPRGFVVEKATKAPVKIVTTNFAIGDTVRRDSVVNYGAFLATEGSRIHLFYSRTIFHDTAPIPSHKYTFAIYYQQLDTNLNVTIPEKRLLLSNHTEQYEPEYLQTLAIINDRLLLTYVAEDTLTGGNALSKLFMLRAYDGLVLKHDTVLQKLNVVAAPTGYYHHVLEAVAYPGNKIIFSGQQICGGFDGYVISDTALNTIDTFYSGKLVYNGPGPINGNYQYNGNVVALPSGSVFLGGSFNSGGGTGGQSALSKHKISARLNFDTVAVFGPKNATDWSHGASYTIKNIAYSSYENRVYLVENTHFNSNSNNCGADTANYLEVISVDTNLRKTWRKFIYSGGNRCAIVTGVTACVGRPGILLAGTRRSISNPSDTAARSFFLYRIDSATNTTLNAGGSDLTIRDRFRIYPNPATDALMIDDILHAVTAASVYDMQGRLAQQAPVSANPARLSLKTLPQGSYLLRLQLKDGSSHSQLFIRRE